MHGTNDPPSPDSSSDAEGAPPPSIVIDEAPPTEPASSGGADSAPPKPTEPEPVSVQRGVALGLALVFGGLFGLLPAAFFSWFIGVTLITSATAEALDATFGLDAGTFESAYWFVLAVNLTALVWSLLRAVRRLPRPMLPIVTLILAYATGLVFFVGTDLGGSADFPSGITTFFLLGAESLWRWVAPFALLLLLGWGLWRAFRAGQASLPYARMFTALGVIAGLGGLQLLFGSSLLNAADLQLAATPSALAGPGDPDGELRGMIRIASIDGLGDDRPNARRDLFAECSNELATATENGRRFLDTQILWLASPPKAMRFVDAEDLVMDTLLRVCRRHMKSALQSIKPYFVTALKNARATFCSRARREVPGDPTRLDACPVGFRSVSDGLALREAMGQLSVDEQHILVRSVVEGLSSAELGVELGVHEVTARQRKRRALRHLSHAYRGEL